MKSLTPNLAVKDIRKSVAFYTKELGFTLRMAVSEDKSSVGNTLVDDTEYIWANVMCDDVGFMFQRIDSLKEDVGDFFETVGASSTFYIEVNDVDVMYQQISNKVEIIKELETTWYGAKEFYIKDPDGYILAFSTVGQS